MYNKNINTIKVSWPIGILRKKLWAERHPTMKKKCLASMLLALIISTNFACSIGNAAPSTSTSTSTSQTTTATNNESEFPMPNAQAFIIKDTKSGQIINSNNPDSKVYPAGLTNIMTAIVVLENKSLSDTCIVTEEALSGVTYDQPQFGMKVGEVYTVEELLHAIILNSNNDASNVLAISVAGSIDEFVKKIDPEKGIFITPIPGIFSEAEKA